MDNIVKTPPETQQQPHRRQRSSFNLEMELIEKDGM